MKRGFFIMYAAAVFLIVTAKENIYAEYVFQKDGAIVEGTIISDTAGSLTVKTKDGKIKHISRSSIMRLLYTELYMGKVYVQRTDGKNVICYMVDEDRESYTFRKELFSPEEFKIKRDQVLFMARGNPTGLEGEAGLDRVDLKWFPPYNPVKRYRIYIKAPGDKAFSVADETGGKSAIIKKLKSNTKYQFHVTAVDDAGDESIPSNELVIATRNIKPYAPGNISIENKYSADRKTFTAEITWGEASDPDGKVVSYNIYRHDSDREELAGKSVTSSYQVKGLAAEKYYCFSVKTVDDKKDESEEATYVFTAHPPLTVDVRADYLIPIRNLGDLLGWGCGLLLSAYKTDFILHNFDAGVTAGVWYFTAGSNSVISSFMIPVMSSFRFNIPVTMKINLTASVNAGYWYNSIDYRKLNSVTLQPEIVNKSAFEPGIYTSLTADYKISERTNAFTGVGYGLIFEPDGRMELISISAGVALRIF